MDVISGKVYRLHSNRALDDSRCSGVVCLLGRMICFFIFHFCM